MSLLAHIDRYTRRALTGAPSSATPESHVAWLQEQIRAYATPQPFAGPLTGDDNLTGETWEIREAYRRFALKEPAAFAALTNKTLEVCRLDPQVQPEDKDDPAHQKAAAWVDWAVRRASGGWPQLLFNVALPAQIDGFSVTEKVFDTVPRDHPKYPGWWTLAAAKSKDTKFIRLRLDPYKTVVGVQAMAAGQGGRPVDPGDVILFTFMKLFESPFGLSAFRPVHRAVTMISSAIKLRSILLENFSGPYLVARSDDPVARGQMLAVMERARARGFIVVPEGAKLDVLNLATSAPEQFQATIEDMRKEIYLGVTGAYLQALESSTPQGDSATHAGQTTPFKWWLSVSLCACLSEQLVPDLVEPNFGGRGGRPMLALGGVDTASVIRELDKMKKVKDDLGCPISRAQVYDVSGVEPPRDDGDAVQPAPPPQPQPGGTLGGGGGSPFQLAGANPRRPTPPALGPARPEPVTFAEDSQGNNHGSDGKFAPKGGGAAKPKADARPKSREERRAAARKAVHDDTLAHLQGLADGDLHPAARAAVAAAGPHVLTAATSGSGGELGRHVVTAARAAATAGKAEGKALARRTADGFAVNHADYIAAAGLSPRHLKAALREIGPEVADALGRAADRVDDARSLAGGLIGGRADRMGEVKEKLLAPLAGKLSVNEVDISADRVAESLRDAGYPTATGKTLDRLNDGADMTAADLYAAVKPELKYLGPPAAGQTAESYADDVDRMADMVRAGVANQLINRFLRSARLAGPDEHHEFADAKEFAEDAAGHEHRGKGPGGGQFVRKGGKEGDGGGESMQKKPSRPASQKPGFRQLPISKIKFPQRWSEEVTPLDGNYDKPAVVTPNADGTYRLIDGYGRVSGLHNAGGKKIHAVVVSPADVAANMSGQGDDPEWVAAMHHKYAPHSDMAVSPADWKDREQQADEEEAAARRREERDRAEREAAERSDAMRQEAEKTADPDTLSGDQLFEQIKNAADATGQRLTHVLPFQVMEGITRHNKPEMLQEARSILRRLRAVASAEGGAGPQPATFRGPGDPAGR